MHDSEFTIFIKYSFVKFHNTDTLYVLLYIKLYIILGDQEKNNECQLAVDWNFSILLRNIQ